MRNIKKITHLFVYSNTLIALCASSLCYYSILFFNLEFYILETIGFVFFSTVFTYAFHRKTDHLYYGNREITQQDIWIKENNITYNWILVVSFIGSFSCYLLLPKVIGYLLFPLILISLLYVIKFNLGIRIKPLRSIPFLKPFLIAFVWGGIATLLPIVNNLGLDSLTNIKYHLFAFSIGLFVFGQSIPFDIRDYNLDKYSNLKTLPHLIGSKHTKQLSFFCYTVTLITVCAISIEINSLQIALAMALFFSGIIIYKLSDKKSDLHFSLIHESGLAFPLFFLNILTLI